MPFGDADPILIFDLDETILLVNSFPLWVRFLLVGNLPGLCWRRWWLSGRVAWLVAQRKLGRIDHDALLYHLQRAWRDAARDRDQVLIRGFLASLMRQVRPNLPPLLDLVATGRADGILATAAASDYAAALARQLGFSHALTTLGDGGEPAPRNAGVNKRDGVLALLQRKCWDTRPRVLFTDHADDLPLIRECDVVCWFGRDAACLGLADGPVQFIPCAGLDSEAILAELRMFSPSPMGRGLGGGVEVQEFDPSC